MFYYKYQNNDFIINKAIVHTPYRFSAGYPHCTSLPAHFHRTAKPDFRFFHSTYASLRCYPCQMPSFHRKYPEKYFSRFVSHADSFSDSAVLLPIKSNPHRTDIFRCHADKILTLYFSVCADCSCLSGNFNPVYCRFLCKCLRLCHVIYQ